MTISKVFFLIVQTSLYGAVVGMIVFLLKTLLGKKMPAKWQYLIWFILLLKLLIPFGPESGISIFNHTKMPINITKEAVLERIVFNERDHTLPPDNIPRTLFNKINFWGIVPYVWALGCSIFILWLLLTNLFLNQKLRKNSYITSNRILNIFTVCKAKVNLKKKVSLVTQSYIKSPSLFGLFLPKILITKDLESMTDKDIEYTLLHEFAHLKRGDIGVNYLLLLLQSVHWFNPIMWFFFKKM